MQEPMRGWRMATGDLSQYEFLGEAEMAQLTEQHPIDLAAAVRAGDDLVLAKGDCVQCKGACRLWFMTDAETPAEVCPYLVFFADFTQSERRTAS